MNFTLTKRIWERERPSCCKGSGVAAAIKAIDSGASKAAAVMTSTETAAAKKAIDKGIDALDLAVKKSKKDKKDYSTFERLVGIWRKEYTDGLAALTARNYALKVENVQQVYDSSYSGTRDDFVAAADAADTAMRTYQGDPTQLPSAKDLQIWMTKLRDFNNIASKQGITGLTNPNVKLIRVSDIVLPADLKANKARAKTLMQQCEVFAKAIKKGTKNVGDSLGDSAAVDKAVKKLLNAYKDVLKTNKEQTVEATKLAAQSKALAGQIKTLVQQEATTRIDKPDLLNQARKKIAAALKDVRDRNVALHQRYRVSGGDLSDLAADIRKTDGYDVKKHGSIIEKGQSNCQLAIRLVTLQVSEGDRQIERINRFMSASSSLRGYL